MPLVTRDLLAQLSEEARRLPRLRKNYNLHSSNDSTCHRLLNAVEPGTYIRPHRHLDPEKGEAMVLMSGSMGVLFFSEDGVVQERLLLSSESGNLAVDIPAGTYHSVISLQSGTVFFEAKAGPYLALTEQELAGWAPAEQDAGCLDYLQSLREHFL